MDSQSEFGVTDRLKSWAMESDNKALIEEISNNDDFTPAVISSRSYTFEDYTAALIEEFLTSASYTALPESDKSMVIRAFKVFFEGNPKWRVEGASANDSLLENRETVREVDAKPDDILLTCGITLLDIDRLKPNWWNDHPEWPEGRVEFANMIGAAIVTNVAQSFNEQVANGYAYAASPYVNVETLVSGDVHGDLRIAQRERYIKGSINPVGIRVPYAPYAGSTTAAAYHSSEPELLICVLKHMYAIGLADQRQKEILESAIIDFSTEESTRLNRNPFGGAFADYGDEDGLDFHIESMVDYFRNEEATLVKEQLWSDILVRPQSKDRLRVRTVESDLELQNVRLAEDGSIDDYCGAIRIGTDQIKPFMKALLHQTAIGAGRTAPHSLLKLISARQELFI